MRPYISYVTTCMNRLHHLNLVYNHNIWTQRNLPVEFVLLNYDSKDGLHDWAMEHRNKDATWHKVTYVRLKESQDHFFNARAKNIAHLYARGLIVCNLDADMTIPFGLTEFLIQHLGGFERVYAAPREDFFYGLVAMKRQHFDELGGYDERLNLGPAFEDTDLTQRADAIGLKRAMIPDHFRQQLHHEVAEKMTHSKTKDLQEVMNQHYELMRTRPSNVANGGKFGQAEVEVMFFG